MTPIVVANWKMQLGITESVTLAQALHAKLLADQSATSVVVCPSFLSLPYVKDPLSDGRIRLGAQDVFWSDRGAYTGEVSPASLQEMGVEYVIVGHSERRQLGESDTDVARKTLAAIAHHISPIICVGESADQRSQGRQEVVVQEQLKKIFRSTPPPPRGQTIYIAYEPIWAIGTGEAADAVTADAMRALIRQTLIDLFPSPLVESSFRIIYGGSVEPANVANYVAPNMYDGALVGGASLQVDSLFQLIQTVSRAYPAAT